MVLKVAVIGAGIIGVSTALRVLESNPGKVDVRIFSGRQSPFNTSDVAAGFWEPIYMSNTAPELQSRWGVETYKFLEKYVNHDVGRNAGIFYLSGYQLFPEQEVKSPPWKDLIPDFRLLTREELDRYPGSKSGFFFTSLIAQGSKLIPWLTERFLALGGKSTVRTIKNLNELAFEYDIVINCSGLEARHLTRDDKLFPIRGHVLRVKAPWLKHFILRDTNPPSYAIPNEDWVIVGGTTHRDNWSTIPTDTDRRSILEGISKLVPALAKAPVLGEYVGLRPGRDEVRLESEHVQYGTKKFQVIHNYGHGGGGLSVFWGCAGDVNNLVQDTIKQRGTLHSKM
ncbi:D-amino-acid oxidase-like [Tubulanus polymorphus]|uniref:D-amino-acid oxidase-like n=1 Tax=Tubulanus polymorphus TaxID=672921 RepID=UPI003DA339EB